MARVREEAFEEIRVEEALFADLRSKHTRTDATCHEITCAGTDELYRIAGKAILLQRSCERS